MTRTICVPDPALPLVHVAISSRIGAAADPPEKEGATRLLLGLMKRSIRGMSPEEVEETCDRLGGSIGIDVTRSVGGLHGSMIARSSDALLDLLRKMVLEPAFEESEFERLKEEACAHWLESLDNDSVLARRQFSRSVFREHPYGRLPSGTPKTLKRVGLDDIITIYRELFSHDRLVFSFAGDVDEERCSEFSESLGSRLQHPTSETFHCNAPAPLSGRRLVFVDKPERSQTQILIGGLGTHPRDEDHTALFVANTIFGGTFTSRLSQKVRGERGWSYGASSNLPFDRQRQAFSMWTFPKTEDALSCIQLELELLETFIERGVTKRELKNAQRYIKNSYPFSIDTASKRASLRMDEALYDLPEGYYENQVARVLAVTEEDIHAAIRRRLSARDVVIVVVGTRGRLYDSLEKGIQGLSSSECVPFDAAE